jgi:SAM-dependent methyltransferase
MGRFATVVPYYERFRQPYPPAFYDGLGALLGLDGTQALVDLGCGPAILALGFAPRVRRVVGVDPEPEMAAAARAAAARAGVSLEVIQSRAEDLPAEMGPFDVATIGRALHWMDPGPTCAALDRLLGPSGRIAICGSATAEDANPWLRAYEAVRDGFKLAKDDVDYRRDTAAFVAGSPFAIERSFAVRTEQAITADILAGRLLSMSNTSPAVLGDRVGLVPDEVRRALAPFVRSDGTLAEVIEARAVLVSRVR